MRTPLMLLGILFRYFIHSCCSCFSSLLPFRFRRIVCRGWWTWWSGLLFLLLLGVGWVRSPVAAAVVVPTTTTADRGSDYSGKFGGRHNGFQVQQRAQRTEPLFLTSALQRFQMHCFFRTLVDSGHSQPQSLCIPDPAQRTNVESFDFADLCPCQMARFPILQPSAGGVQLQSYIGHQYRAVLFVPRSLQQYREMGFQ